MKGETKQGQIKEVQKKKAYRKPELTKHESLRVVTQGICVYPDPCTEVGGS